MECLSPPMTETPTGRFLVQSGIFKCSLKGGFPLIFSVLWPSDLKKAWGCSDCDFNQGTKSSVN